MAHFNRLTPAQAERLALLAEECGELIHAIGKILRHGYESYHPDTKVVNRDQLAHEIGDVRAALTIMEASGDISDVDVTIAKYEKLRRIEQYLHHNRVPYVPNPETKP